MTQEQSTVKEWMANFGQETPDRPIIPSLEVRKLRAKLILEEALETIHALGLYILIAPGTQELGPESLQQYQEDISIEVNKRDEDKLPNLELIADGCEDLKVVTEGTLIACGLVRDYGEDNDVITNDPLFNEVMRSNNSKFWTDVDIKYEAFEAVMNNPAAASLMQAIEVLEDRDLIAKETDEANVFLVKDSAGKVIKSPSYLPPKLAPIIKAME